MVITSFPGEHTELLLCHTQKSLSYRLTSHILSSSDFPSCTSFSLLIYDEDSCVLLEDLTVNEHCARLITRLFYKERVLPEHADCIAEDLLTDPFFIY